LYEDQKTFVNIQFENFHKKVENLKQLELNNLDHFKDFFQGKFTELENKINDLIDEKVEGNIIINLINSS